MGKHNDATTSIAGNKHEPLISVVMPAYNVEKFIARSIESVLTQTYSNWELIVVDDGSTDATKDIILCFCATDKRISYTYQQNGKQGKARNTGIARANGALVAFLDADDVWFPFMLEQQYDLLIKSGANLVFSSIFYVDECLNYLPDKHVPGISLLEGPAGAEILLKGDNPMPIITILTKKESLIAAGLFRTSPKTQFGEEFELWLRMLLNGAKFVCNKCPVALYVMHPKQSSKLAEHKYFQVLEIIRQLPADSKFAKVKNQATCIWIRRCLRFSAVIDRKMLRKVIGFLPSSGARAICLAASVFLSDTLLKKTINKVSYHI